VLLDGFYPILSRYTNENLKSTYLAIKDVLNGKSMADGWQKPDSYNVTSLFVGRDEENTMNDIYRNFQDD
jgi:hypothetical protein